MTGAMSPSTQPATAHRPFTPSTPPPLTSGAALPSLQLPMGNDMPHSSDGADIRRHQSLTQGYGSSSRVRERLERSPALLSLEQRETLHRRLKEEQNHVRSLSGDREEPPTSPIGRSVWSFSHPEDDGWSRPGSQNLQLQDAFEAMQLGRRMMGMEHMQKDRLSVQRDGPRLPSPTNRDPAIPSIGHTGEEPSWVSNLVGMPDRLSPQPATRPSSAPNWHDSDDAFLRAQTPQRWPEQSHFLGQSMGYLQHQQHQQQQQQLFAAQGFGNGVGSKQILSHQPQYYPPQYPPAYMATPFTPVYPTPPVSAMPAQDQDVIDLARRKGLNPASFNCRPSTVRVSSNSRAGLRFRRHVSLSSNLTR